MNWLDTTESSLNIGRNNSVGNVSNLRNSDNFFEFDDDTTGVDIDGYLFFPKSVEGDESFSHREFIRTKIMSGGEFVSRGQYIPKEFSFDTIIDINPDEIDKYLEIFALMENKVCRVTSPYMGVMFKAEVSISVTNPESSPHVIECTVKIKEIPDVMARLYGDPLIKYPSVNTVSDISVRERKGENKNDEKKSHELYDDYTPGSHSQLPTGSSSN